MVDGPERKHLESSPLMTTSAAKSNWLIPTGLIALSIAPVAADVFRLTQLGGGVITPENARFFAAPLPVVLHVISVTIFCILGAFQFAPAFRRRRPDWHRAAGRVLVPCVRVAVVEWILLRERRT